MGTYSDFRTIAGAMTPAQSVAFAHGLGAVPDIVILQQQGTLYISTGSWNAQASMDAVGVTLTANVPAVGQTPNLKVWTILAHSIIR